MKSLSFGWKSKWKVLFKNCCFFNRKKIVSKSKQAHSFALSSHNPYVLQLLVSAITFHLMWYIFIFEHFLLLPLTLTVMACDMKNHLTSNICIDLICAINPLKLHNPNSSQTLVVTKNEFIQILLLFNILFTLAIHNIALRSQGWKASSKNYSFVSPRHSKRTQPFLRLFFITLF